MAMHRSIIQQASVEKWLKEHQSFTNNFLLEWVCCHPELYREILINHEEEKLHSGQQKVGHQHSTPKKVHFTISDSLVPPMEKPELVCVEGSSSITRSCSFTASSGNLISSGDSGVEIVTSQSCCELDSLGAKEKDTKNMLAIDEFESSEPTLSTADDVCSKELEVVTGNNKQLEAFFKLTVSLFDNLSNPQYVMSTILLETRTLFPGCCVCRLLLLEDQLDGNGFKRTCKELRFIAAFEVSPAASKITKVPVENVKGLDMATEVARQGHLYMLNKTKDILCTPLFGVEGQVVGILQLVGCSLGYVDLTSTKSAALATIETFATLSGLAIDNSFCFAKLRKATTQLLSVSSKLQTLQKKAATAEASAQCRLDVAKDTVMGEQPLQSDIGTTVDKQEAEEPSAILSVTEEVTTQDNDTTEEDDHVYEVIETPTSVAVEENSSRKHKRSRCARFLRAPFKALRRLFRKSSKKTVQQ